ncbi:phage tail tape measure protein [Anaerotruncus colihominis]|uniref:Phage tail tape measure protein, TP901 family n=1 Tax=Anaerotruncus colihominis DSM 17241 TaxID=445972 RepID=B0PEZ1_9FIRM|nr:phage tail tape measure protein [Anaerotruncus colihominis]EDS09924.1 phage tail tape measure protein, TP901 family [Anaerotruncus colihominis DSM 17241]UWN73973.1 phage tail tape measure protein [Anaerotruncus colihominis]
MIPLAKNKILQAVVDVAGSIDPSLGKMMDGVTKLLEGINLKALAVAGAVGGIAVATGKAVLAAGSYLSDLGQEYNTAINDLSASTGATGEELQELGDIVKNVYKSGMGESLADVSNGLATVEKISDLAGDQLESATQSAFLLSDSFEFEIGESARAASALMKNFGLDADQAYGMIAIGAQNGADKNGDLLDTLNEYSGQYAALGLTADQFMGSLISGADAGLFSIDKVGDAVKEFNIRAKDESDSSAQAFQSLGFNADDMFASFAAGGDKAQTAFFETVNALNDLDDPLKKNQIGVALFGSQFEDLEAGVLPVLGSIETAAYDGAAALQQINDVKYNDLGSAFEAVKRSAEVALLPMASMIANTLTSLAPILSETFEAISPVITDTLNACMPFIEEFLVGMGDTLKAVIPMIAQLAAELLPVLTQLMSTLLPPLLDLIQQLLPPFMQIVQAVLPPLASILATILPILTQIAAAVLPVLAQMINSLMPAVTPLLDILAQILNSVITPLLEPLSSLAQALLPAITHGLEISAPVLELIGSLLSTVVGWIAKVVEWVASGLGWVVDLFTGKAKAGVAPEGYAAGGFTSGLSYAGEDPRYPTEAVISFNPAYRRQNLGYWERAGRMLGVEPRSMEPDNYFEGIANVILVSTLQPFAAGGFTSGPGIVGEDPRYPTETVISFNPAYRQQNLGYWAQAGQMLGASDFDDGVLQGGGSNTVIYDLGGVTFAPQVTVGGNADKDDIIQQLKDLEPEFFDLLETWLRKREAGKYVTANHGVF